VLSSITPARNHSQAPLGTIASKSIAYREAGTAYACSVMAEKFNITIEAPNDEEVFQPEPRPGARIRFGEQDEETGRRPSVGPRMSRTNTTGSQISISSVRGRRFSVDPATALPITYRTVSYAINETKEQEKVEAAHAKQDAAAELGDLDWHTISVNDVETRLSTSLIRGLSREQVEKKAKEFGKNMPSKPPSDLASRVFGYLFGGFGSVLLIGGVGARFLIL